VNSPKPGRTISSRYSPPKVFRYIGATSRLHTHQQFFLKNRDELPNEAPQSVAHANYQGLQYMKYGHYVSHKDGREKIHILG
jgi:hypothetical protein